MLLYFLRWIIAATRDHRQTGRLFATVERSNILTRISGHRENERLVCCSVYQGRVIKPVSWPLPVPFLFAFDVSLLCLRFLVKCTDYPIVYIPVLHVSHGISESLAIYFIKRANFSRFVLLMIIASQGKIFFWNQVKASLWWKKQKRTEWNGITKRVNERIERYPT